MTRPELADRRDVADVYEVAEDSVLLADAATEEATDDDRVLDVGTGTGYVAAEVATTGAGVVGVDVNPHACRRASESGLPVVRGDLVTPFRDDAFDLVTFNPPYLPTPPEAEWDDWMEAALSGGSEGRRVIDPFLDSVGRVLAPGGRVLLLISTLTDEQAVTDRAAANGFSPSIVAEESHPFEKLLVVRLALDD